ncbi:hypothetical protein E8E11_011175 [Didymella keratinophila]|nr:hypothetical protein E8E11_011175 [Didymella keratinophila]
MDLSPPDFITDSLNTLKGDYSVTSASFPINSSKIIDELYQPYAEVTLHLLDASKVVYAQSTQDPWFSATTPIQDDDGLGEVLGGVASQLYSSDAPANVLGCVTERFYCNPSLPSSVGCIDSFGYIRGSNRTYKTNEEDAVPSIWPDAKEQSVMRSLLSTLSMGVTLDSLHVIPTSPTLLARRTLFGNLQMEQLPLDQWKIEQEHLFKKIRSSKFYSFSAWSLALIFLVGNLTMLIAMFLENIINLILRIPWLSFSRLEYAHAEWKAESTLQLHRLAHENLGLGRWTKTDEAIPVTHVGDTLAMLDVRDAKHARMVAPSEELEHLTPSPMNDNVRMRAKYERVPSSVQL